MTTRPRSLRSARREAPPSGEGGTGPAPIADPGREIGPRTPLPLEMLPPTPEGRRTAAPGAPPPAVAALWTEDRERVERADTEAGVTAPEARASATSVLLLLDVSAVGGSCSAPLLARGGVVKPTLTALLLLLLQATPVAAVLLLVSTPTGLATLTTIPSSIARPDR